MNLLLYRVRRALLRTLVPERVWPESVTMDGATIRIRHAPYSFGTKKVLSAGQYEVDERRLLARALRPGDVVIEMGGSIGILTAIIAHQVGTTGFVVSVEASTDLTSYSRTWLERGGNVKVLTGFAFPVWKLAKRVRVEKFEELWGSMSGRLTFAVADSATAPASENPLYDVSTAASFAPRAPSVLVCDIESSERIIAEQEPGFPDSLRHVMMELHPGMYGEETARLVHQRIVAEGFVEVGREGTSYLFERGGARGG